MYYTTMNPCDELIASICCDLRNKTYANATDTLAFHSFVQLLEFVVLYFSEALLIDLFAPSSAAV